MRDVELTLPSDAHEVFPVFWLLNGKVHKELTLGVATVCQASRGWKGESRLTDDLEMHTHILMRSAGELRRKFHLWRVVVVVVFDYEGVVDLFWFDVA